MRWLVSLVSFQAETAYPNTGASIQFHFYYHLLQFAYIVFSQMYQMMMPKLDAFSSYYSKSLRSKQDPQLEELPFPHSIGNDRPISTLFLGFIEISYP